MRMAIDKIEHMYYDNHKGANIRSQIDRKKRRIEDGRQQYECR